MAGGVPTWEEVARDHGRFLYNVAYRLAGNDSDAQDLVQEALLRVRKGLERYQPGSLEGWLARIVTNVFLDEVRRRRRRPADSFPEDPDWVIPPAPAADEVSTGFSDEVQAALAALPEEFRSAVVLCDVADLPYEEKLDRYRELADAYFQVDEYTEFCDEHLGHLDEVALEYFGGAEFDHLLVETVASTFPAHEHEAMVARHRGLIGGWVADQSAVRR